MAENTSYPTINTSGPEKEGARESLILNRFERIVEAWAAEAGGHGGLRHPPHIFFFVGGCASVEFHAFNLAVCMTNFVAAGCHLKDRNLTHVSFYSQLQTFWLYLLREFVWVVT